MRNKSYHYSILFIITTLFQVYSQQLTINGNIGNISIKSIFVIAEPIKMIEVYDSAAYIQAWKESYEELFLKCGFNVITRDNINTIFKEMSLNMTGAIESDSLIKTGKLIGADGVFLLRATFFNDSIFTESFKLISIETGQIASQGHFNNKDDYKNGSPKDMRKKIVQELCNVFLSDKSKR